MWSIGELWHYPVKSMLGERLDAVSLDDNGVIGDRAYALLDVASGRVASAKRPGHFGALFECRASARTDASGRTVVTATLPDGSAIRMDDPSAGSALSEYLGREVRVVTTVPSEATYEMAFPDIAGAAPTEFAEMTGIDERDSDGPISAVAVGLFAPGTFLDVSPLHVMAASTLVHLSRSFPETAWDVRRFRPNIVIAGDSDMPFVEESWANCELVVGDGVVLGIGPSTPRCVMTTLPQPGLTRDLAVLRTLARENRQEIPEYGHWACLGTYGSVDTAGVIRVGDRVEVRALVG